MKSILSFLFVITLLVSCGGGGGTASDNRPSPTTVYMWVTTTTRTGNLGGVSGGNTICQNDASGVTFNTAVTNHRAALFTSTNDPRNYFRGRPIVKRPGGTTITNTYSDFWNSSVTAVNTVHTSGIGYWVGDRSNNCSNWTNGGATAHGVRGRGDEVDSDRYSTGTPGSRCDTTGLFILCLSY